MSIAAVRIARPLPTPDESPERHLRPLPRPVVRRAPRVMHGVVALGGLAAIIAAQLGVSVALSSGAYELTSLQATSAELGRNEQTLQEALDVARSPQHVAMQAERLGMVQGQASQFLQLSTSSVLGGPDALHIPASALTSAGTLAVPNALVLTEAQAAEQAAAAAAAAAAEAGPYPGMLLPAEGVAPTQ